MSGLNGPSAGSPWRWAGPSIAAHPRTTTPCPREHPAGIEPAAPTWKEGRLAVTPWMLRGLVEVAFLGPLNEHGEFFSREPDYLVWGVCGAHLHNFAVGQHFHAATGLTPARLFPCRVDHERHAGIEPAMPPWQGDVLPLHQWREATPTGFEPASSTLTRWCSAVELRGHWS